MLLSSEVISSSLDSSGASSFAFWRISKAKTTFLQWRHKKSVPSSYFSWSPNAYALPRCASTLFGSRRSACSNSLSASWTSASSKSSFSRSYESVQMMIIYSSCNKTWFATSQCAVASSSFVSSTSGGIWALYQEWNRWCTFFRVVFWWNWTYSRHFYCDAQFLQMQLFSSVSSFSTQPAFVLTTCIEGPFVKNHHRLQFTNACDQRWCRLS